jgi:hypothetical protein
MAGSGSPSPPTRSPAPSPPRPQAPHLVQKEMRGELAPEHAGVRALVLEDGNPEASSTRPSGWKATYPLNPVRKTRDFHRPPREVAAHEEVHPVAHLVGERGAPDLEHAGGQVRPVREELLGQGHPVGPGHLRPQLPSAPGAPVEPEGARERRARAALVHLGEPRARPGLVPVDLDPPAHLEAQIPVRGASWKVKRATERSSTPGKKASSPPMSICRARSASQQGPLAHHPHGAVAEGGRARGRDGVVLEPHRFPRQCVPAASSRAISCWKKVEIRVRKLEAADDSRRPRPRLLGLPVEPRLEGLLLHGQEDLGAGVVPAPRESRSAGRRRTPTRRAALHPRPARAPGTIEARERGVADAAVGGVQVAGLPGRDAEGGGPVVGAVGERCRPGPRAIHGGPLQHAPLRGPGSSCGGGRGW